MNIHKLSNGMENDDYRNKYSVFDVDYDFYFQNNQGMFVVRTQNAYKELINSKVKENIIKQMNSINQFDDIREELYQEDIYMNQKTLCFDVRNVFIKEMDLSDIENFFEIQKDFFDDKDFETNYIVVHRKADSEEVKHNNDNQDQFLTGIQNIKKRKQCLVQLIASYRD